jgi:glucose/arabinose dehydrogenase
VRRLRWRKPAGSASALVALLVAGAGCDERHVQSSPPPAVQSAFRKVVLDPDPGEPMSLAVLPDSSVLYASRLGQVWWLSPEGEKLEAARFDVYTHDEEGLQGLALDPDFENNHWVYLYYSPPLDTPRDDPATASDEGAAPEAGTSSDWDRFRGALRLSRFRFEAPALDLGSEQVLLEVPVDRGLCCHVGGQIDFDAAGNLYLSTGDDSNPFASDGYAPIDESPGRNPGFDAQRSAGNTNDLRGKLLRIHVEPDGSYSIPEGNLFAPGTPQTRPEIYLMGLRNPFRFAVDRDRGVIYLADYSPDARAASPQRGPVGTGKWLVARQPGNYGWPYCATPELPYVAYDFASGASGAAFDCQHPVNHSAHNTGLVELPPVLEPELAYSYGTVPGWPELGSGGVGPMAGPAYVFSGARSSSVQWPKHYAGLPLFYEWTRDLALALHPSASGTLERMEPLPFTLDNPMDLEFGPDGALYALEYGDGYYQINPGAQLTRVEYTAAEE